MNHNALEQMLDELKTVVKGHVREDTDIQVDILSHVGGRRSIRIVIPDVSTLDIEFCRCVESA